MSRIFKGIFQYGKVLTPLKCDNEITSKLKQNYLALYTRGYSGKIKY